MPRACVIVLDAVGAGELPDAAEFGDEGSNTLANVARAVGGLDLPTLEALGLGNVEPLEGCAPQPGAPAIAGRLLERSKGKDTTTGHWELMGVVTPSASAWSRATASARPCSAIASTYGSVAFVSAFVEVMGTPPGMFATQ